MLSMWVTAALLALCGGEYSEHEGRPLHRSLIHLKMMHCRNRIGHLGCFVVPTFNLF